jgi:hypothetical protein
MAACEQLFDRNESEHLFHGCLHQSRLTAGTLDVEVIMTITLELPPETEKRLTA